MFLGARPLCRRLRGRGCANCQSLPHSYLLPTLSFTSQYGLSPLMTLTRCVSCCNAVAGVHAQGLCYNDACTAAVVTPQEWGLPIPSLCHGCPTVFLCPVQPPSLSGLGQPLHCLAEWPGPGHSTSLCLSFPPLSPLGPRRVGGMTRGQCRFQGEFSDLRIPHTPRGGETFFTQHCRGQTLGHPLLRSSPRRGPEGVLCRCLGSWGWALHGGGWGLDQLGSSPTPPLREKAVAPGPARVCTLHRNLCGCFSKKREWRSQIGRAHV